jgi:DNA polymerase III subunit epsilon
MYAVVDTETTGLSPTSDRIIELAIIGLDECGEPEWEWCSLINPERDTGPGLAVRVHQIYPRDVAGVPRFSDYVGHILSLLAGRAVISHNAAFDLGMLAAEFARARAPFPAVPQICTATMARAAGFRPYRLEACCQALDIRMEGAHHALADARATAELARALIGFPVASLQREIEAHLQSIGRWPTVPVMECEPVQRPIVPCRSSVGGNKSHAQPSAGDKGVPVVESFSLERETPESRYLAAVEWVLEDREISAEQQDALAELRFELGLDRDQVHEVHRTFLRGLAGSMWRSGSISAHEQYDLDLVGKVLQLSPTEVAEARDKPIDLDLTNEDYLLKIGVRVVFTGEMSMSRSEWKQRATDAGLKVTGSVSGKTDYLVVPYGETGSSKSLKARKLGVRVVSEQRFRRMIERLEREIPAAG